MRKITWALLAAGMTFAASAAPASAATTGPETFHGAIVTSGVIGERTLINSVIVAHGVFDGTGRIVEVDNLPTDPMDVLRDDLVFAGGSMHLVSTIVDFSVSINPHSCVAKATVSQTGRISGGTGRFVNADGSFTGGVRGSMVLPRDPDGSCSMTQESLHEVDRVSAEGTLSL
jgi:hypothetical protein